MSKDPAPNQPLGPLSRLDPPTLVDLVDTYLADPAKWSPVLFATEASAEGKMGSSLGQLPIEPIDSLASRILGSWGAPIVVNLRLRHAKGGFGPVFVHEVSERSRMATVEQAAVVAQQSASTEEKTRNAKLEEEIHALRERLSTPQATATLATNPFEIAAGVLKLAGELAGQRSPTPSASSSSLDVDKVIALAREAAEKAEPKLEMMKAAAPVVTDMVARFFGAADRVFEARKDEASKRHEIHKEALANERARLEIVKVEVFVRGGARVNSEGDFVLPPAAADPSAEGQKDAPPAARQSEAVFGSHGGTTGSERERASEPRPTAVPAEPSHDAETETLSGAGGVP